VADTEQAAAGAEAEPGELRPNRPRLPLPRAILDQLAQLPPLPEAARELPHAVRRDLVSNGAAYLYGVRAAFLVAGGGWLVAASLTLLLWATAAPAGADPTVPLHISGQLWLAAHHVLLHAPDGPFGLSPLGFTLLPVLGLVAAGRRTARRRPEYALRASVGAAAGYAVCACVIAASSAGNGLVPEYVQVVLYPAVIALCGHALGAARAIRELIPDVAAPWFPAALRGTVTALCVYLAAAALLAAGFLIAHADESFTVQREIGGGLPGEAGLFLIDVALVPNAALWGIAVLAGPGFALGTGTSVSLFSVVRGPLPELPLLAAAPGSQHPAAGWQLLLFGVALVAGVAAAAVIGRLARPWPDRITASAATAAAGGLVLALAETYAGGPVAFGPMSVVGATAWLVGALASAELLIAMAVAFGVWYYVGPALEGRLGRRAEYGSYGRYDYSDEELGYETDAAVSYEGSYEDGGVGADVVGDESALDDDGVADLVGEGLVLVVPERGEVPDVAGQGVEDVGERADEGPAEAGDLSVVLPNYPDVQHALADGLAGAALPVEVPEPDDEDVEPADEHRDHGAAGDASGVGPGRGVVGDGLDRGEVVDEAGPVGDEQGDVVDEPGPDPLPPAGEPAG
jgi:Family of unknown function (DUF6350)